MTKPQIWLAAFLGLFIFLFILGRLTRAPREEKKQITNPVPQGGLSNQSQEFSPKEMIVSLGCPNCHGIDLAGTNQAPSILDIKENWSKDKLINYLRNPESFMDGDRFKVFRQKYPGAIMPSFNNISVQDLGKIAEFLLNQ
ncbi:MAG: cytochrome c [Ignavibacteriaceae bacterium]|nr:cytochrome c [Ignavibacteriaceae bacterium]